ncbi:MAG: Ig-like domain-containing protein [Bacteroidetes bacterium]|nr:Ig-like domain-containing protein [Bacteroidota bacterium]
MKKLLLLVSVALVGVVASCKKDNPKPLKLTAITLSKDTVSLNVGDTKSIAFTLDPSNYDKSQLVWRSSDNTIATVDNTGTISGVKEGNVIITVTNQGGTVTSTCLVSILPQLKGIKMVKDTLIMHAGNTRTVDITLTPVNSSSNTLVWNSSDTSVLKVNAGLITAKKQGQAIVSVSSQDGTLTTFTLVTILPAIDDLGVGLVAYYPLNNTGADFSGNGYDCTTLFNITATTDRHGKANGAYYFDGTTSYMSVPDNQALRLANSDFTMSAWIKILSYDQSSGTIIFSKRLAGVNNGYTFGVAGQTGPSLGVITYGPGGGSINAIGTRMISLDQWSMVTLVYNNSARQASIYVNGVLDNVSNNVDPNNSTISAILYIGRDNPANADDGYFFHGSMDELRIYNRALSAADVVKLYNFVDPVN